MKPRLKIHSRGLLAEFADRLRGRDELLIRAGEDVPLVVAIYPRGHYNFAASLEGALSTTFHSLARSLRDTYRDVLDHVPTMIVAELRARNGCTCLGHRHIPGTGSRLARRLMKDLGSQVGEIDLAVEAIRGWEPLPLSDFAAAGSRPSSAAEFEHHRFHTALLSVFLHELEHLAYPERAERDIREHSNSFYVGAMRQFVTEELGVAYGI